MHSAPAYAQGRIFKEVRNAAAYPFLLYLPENLPEGEKPPVILFLHGRSLSGRNLNAVRRYGVLDAIERGRRIPAIVAAPQVARRSSWEPDKVLSILEYIQNHYDTDTTRVYVAGMSLGGYGTLHFAGKYPDRIAAAAALCGGGKIADACNLGRTNLWIAHGKRDRAVPYTASLAMYNAIAACNPGAECTLTLYPAWGHADMARVFNQDTLYNWLFRFARGNRSDSLLSPQPRLIVEGGEEEKGVEHPARLAGTRSRRGVHVVRTGDTLTSIARRYKTSIEGLCRINRLKETSLLRIGQKISVR